jgi:hypothetical protein
MKEIAIQTQKPPEGGLCICVEVANYSLSSLSFSDCFHLSKSPSVVEPEFDELELEPLPLPPLPLPFGAADASL